MTELRWTLVCFLGMSLVLPSAQGATSPRRLIWANEPVVVLPNQPKPIKYFQHLWGSSVYPLGNGRLGCTVYGGIAEEHIQFNEDTLWTGDEDDTGRFQNFGEMFISLAGHADTAPGSSRYRRELDIEKAVHTLTYEQAAVHYRREYFASHPANVLVFRFTADKKGAYTGTVSLKDAHAGATSAEGKTITISGTVGGKIALKYEAQAVVLNEGGTISVLNGAVRFDACDSLLILLDAGTDYLNRRDKGWKQEPPHRRICERLAEASKRTFDDLLAEHLKDYQQLFNRVTLDLGATAAESRNLATADRLAAYRKNNPDPELEETLFQYARYLMISSSRPGDMPATLQGVWNTYNNPPWRSDYHSDVNVEMNYWFVDAANLPECFLPLAEWVNSIREVRREATKKEFNVRGWATRSENGIFGGATYHWVPGDASWIAQNLWDHYAFTQDKEYLRARAYPVMKELCEYWEDSLKARPDGRLVSPKSQSPEHGPFSEGNSYEQQLAWDLFTNTIEASEALGVDRAFREKLADMKARLLGPQIGKWGQLQEWAEDLDDPKDQHRHLSHLIAVHPGRQISPLTTPKLAEAAKVSMNARGDGSTGWSKVWKICIWARLHEGDRAYKLLGEFIKNNVYPNLWGYHPPFQIDCNFGYAAGVCEMLAQSHMGVIHLLPALPKAWPTGRIHGMRVRGGYEVDLEWKDGKLARALIRNVSGRDGEVEVRYGGTTTRMAVPAGASREFAANEIRGGTTGKFIDAHVHFQDCHKGDLDKVAQWMKSNDVQRCINHPLRQSRPRNDAEREQMIENYRQYQGRIDRFCIIFPDEVGSVEEAVKLLTREKQDGAIGFGEHYGNGLKFDDPANMRLYAACARVGLPVMFHMDRGSNLDERALPRLQNVLKTYPTCILIAHSDWWKHLPDGTCDRLLQTHPNLFADISCTVGRSMIGRDKKLARDFFIRNSDKLLFGTDSGWWSFGKQPAPEFAMIEALDLPREVVDKICRRNAERLFWRGTR